MKEKIKIKTIVCCLMMTSMLLGLGACNNEDDVMEIFNNKTWKLSRIATEKGKEQFYQGLWNNEAGATKVKKKSTVNSILSGQKETTLLILTVPK